MFIYYYYSECLLSKLLLGNVGVLFRLSTSISVTLLGVGGLVLTSTAFTDAFWLLLVLSSVSSGDVFSLSAELISSG